VNVEDISLVEGIIYATLVENESITNQRNKKKLNLLKVNLKSIVLRIMSKIE
jgi:hypothetical protein